MRRIGRAAKARLGRIRRPRNRAIILMYHRIAQDDIDPWGLNVSPQHFAEQLEVISRKAAVLSLNDLLDRLERGKLPERGVTITFDDGYVDNLQAGKPLLERHAMPATVFVTAGMIGSTEDFWWDELQQLTLVPEQLPETVSLTIGGEQISVNLGTDARLQAGDGRHRGWRFHDHPPTKRHALYQTLWRKIQPLPEVERRRVLAELRIELGIPSPEPINGRIMTGEEILRLAEDGLVEIGAHTMTHPVLSQIPLVEQVSEITESRARLERILGTRVTNFAYPHGGRGDYTAATASAVRNAGLRSACTTIEDWLHPTTDPYHLPRIYAPDLDGDAFERLLRTWL